VDTCGRTALLRATWTIPVRRFWIWTAADGIAGALAGQFAIAGHEWGGRPVPRVRMGIHTGEAFATDEGYVGAAVHRAARICATARGGEVLISQTTHDLLADEEGEKHRFILHDVGPKRLKDFDRPVRLYRLTAEGLPIAAPRPRGLKSVLRAIGHSSRRRTIAVGLAAFLLTGIVLSAAFGFGAFETSAGAAPKPRVRLVRSLGNSQPVLIPKAIDRISDPPPYPASLVQSHCDLWWRAWFVRQEAVSLPSDEALEIAAPHSADVTLVRVRAHVFRSYTPKRLSWIQCQATGAGPVPGSQLNLDLEHPDSLPRVASQLGAAAVPSPPAVINIGPGHTEFVVLIPHGHGLYEWSAKLDFVVDQHDETVVVGSRSHPLRTWIGDQTDGGASANVGTYDFDVSSRSWRVLVGNCRYTRLSACPRAPHT